MTGTRNTWLALLAAATVGLTVADLARSQIEQYLVFDCATFGGNCTRDIADFEPLSFFNPPTSIGIQVPGSACEIAEAVGAQIVLNHTWVGDLRVDLSQQSTNRTVTLIDRPGVDVLGDYGCSGHGIDVRIHDDPQSDGGSDYACAVTIPAISGDKTSSLFGQRLVIEPDTPPSFDQCPFVRFEGEVLPAGSDLDNGSCPPLTKPGMSVCRFRGRFNPSCGGEVTVAMTRDGDAIELLIEEESPARFIAGVEGPTRAEIQLFEVSSGSAEITGSVLLENVGLQQLAGSPCAGGWTLHVYDRAAPNVGTVVGWSLLLLPAPTPSPTAPATATPSTIPTATATPPVIDTPVASPSVTATADDTPSDGTPTEPATATPTQEPPTATPTATGTLPSATPTVTGTPPSATPTATDSGPTSTPETATPATTATPGPCVGDCNGDGEVAINELILGVRIALGMSSLEACPSFDGNDNGEVSINELILAVNNALSGCP